MNDQQNAITFAAARADETVIVKTPKGSKIKCKRKASNKKNSTKDVAQQKLAYPRATYVSTGYSKNNCHGTQDPTVTSKWGGGHIWRCGASYCPYNGPICYYGR